MVALNVSKVIYLVLHSSSTRLYHWTSICSSRKDYPCLKEPSLEDKITHKFRKFQESTSTLKLAPNYPSCTITVASCFSCEAPGHYCSSFGEFSHSFRSHDFSVQLYLFSFVFFFNNYCMLYKFNMCFLCDLQYRSKISEP